MEPNHTRHFTAEELIGEDYVFNPVAETIIRQARWGIITDSIIETDDGKHYRIRWTKAATEYQEHEAHDGDYPEVVPVTDISIRKQWVEVDAAKDYSDENQMRNLVETLTEAQKKILRTLLDNSSTNKPEESPTPNAINPSQLNLLRQRLEAKGLRNRFVHIESAGIDLAVECPLTTASDDGEPSDMWAVELTMDGEIYLQADGRKIGDVPDWRDIAASDADGYDPDRAAQLLIDSINNAIRKVNPLVRVCAD